MARIASVAVSLACVGGGMAFVAGCITPIRYVTLLNGEEHRYEILDVQSQTRGGKYVFIASSTKGATFPSEGKDGASGVVVCVVADEVLWPGRLSVGDECRVYLVRFLATGPQRARAVSGSISYDMMKIEGVHLHLNIVLEPEGGGSRFGLKGHIDFEECFRLLRSAPPCMDWAIEETVPPLTRLR